MTSEQHQAKSLVERLRERRKIMWNAPLKDGGFAKLIAPEDLDEAIEALARIEAVEGERDRLHDALVRLDTDHAQLRADLKRKAEALRDLVRSAERVDRIHAPAEMFGALSTAKHELRSPTAGPTDGK